MWVELGFMSNTKSTADHDTKGAGHFSWGGGGGGRVNPLSGGGKTSIYPSKKVK